MPLIRSIASKRRACVAAKILLFSKIIPLYSRCADKGLIYIIIAVPSGCQPSSCIKYTKLNIRLSYNIRLVSNIECIFFARLASC